MTKPIPHLRWWIAGALFLSTVINYIDRQTLSVLAPYIKAEFQWNNTTFALLIISFRVAYAIGQSVSGRWLDRVGIRRGLPFAVGFYSLTAMATSLASGLTSLSAFRFLLGAGESANWPGAAKTVSEWFPRRESGWAVAIYDSGSAIGGAVAPFLVYAVYRFFNDWRPAFVITGLLGLLWIPLFRWLYHAPEAHPRISDAERTDILTNRADRAPTGEKSLPYTTLLRQPTTWGIVLSKALTDPVWFFITDWFAIYLVSKGYQPEQSLLAFWVPFLAADIGNFAGGGLSSYLIQRGWETQRSRRLVAAVCGLGMATLAGAAFTDSFAVMVGCFAASTLAYAGFSTIVLALPGDLYPTGSVASVSGLSGTGAGVGTILATYLTGVVSDRYSFEPVLITASLVPLLATLALVTLVRPPAPDIT
ncbi:MAG: MFS transporter [Bryobacterales bacterium]|nr:MFS transporter [Bryobacterales bacterium]